MSRQSRNRSRTPNPESRGRKGRAGSAPKGNRTPVSTLKEWCPNRWTMRAALRNHSGNGIRTRVTALRGLRPSPLDDTAAKLHPPFRPHPDGQTGVRIPTNRLSRTNPPVCPPEEGWGGVGPSARLPVCPPVRLPACPPAHVPACPPAGQYRQPPREIQRRFSYVVKADDGRVGPAASVAAFLCLAASVRALRTPVQTSQGASTSRLANS